MKLIITWIDTWIYRRCQSESVNALITNYDILCKSHCFISERNFYRNWTPYLKVLRWFQRLIEAYKSEKAPYSCRCVVSGLCESGWMVAYEHPESNSAVGSVGWHSSQCRCRNVWGTLAPGVVLCEPWSRGVHWARAWRHRLTVF